MDPADVEHDYVSVRAAGLLSSQTYPVLLLMGSNHSCLRNGYQEC